jgi:hypothetical protein
VVLITPPSHIRNHRRAGAVIVPNPRGAPWLECRFVTGATPIASEGRFPVEAILRVSDKWIERDWFPPLTRVTHSALEAAWRAVSVNRDRSCSRVAK